MLKLYIFKSKVAQPSKVFTHYWTNEGENFWDTVEQYTDSDGHIREREWDQVNIQSPLDLYLKNYPEYEWVELKATRFQRETIGSLVVDLTAEEFKQAPVLFFKIEDLDKEGNRLDVPVYYYSKGVTYVTDQNLPRTSYRVECPIDSWATFWCYMHSFMKDCTEDFDFLHKMADRFLFCSYTKDEQGKITVDQDDILKLNLDLTPEDSTKNYTWTLDYTVQSYLNRTQDYACDLYMNDVGDGLSYSIWLAMNGVSASDLTKWIDEDYPMSVIDCSKTYSEKSYIKPQKDEPSFIQNTNYIYNTKLTDMDDSRFNSNSKYRYLVTKFGNNNCWSYSLDKDDPDYQKKLDAYNYCRAKLKTDNLDDMLAMLDAAMLGGSKQCINTKKVEGWYTKYEESPTHQIIHLNGESLCIIPFPNAKDRAEEMYLFYLNSHDKGIVLGNGAILGMMINDIPPVILAAALRKFNNTTNVHQTIGDELSLRSIIDGSAPGVQLSCPVSLTSLLLKGNWDWDENKKTFTVMNFTSTDLVERPSEFYGNMRPKQNIPSGYYKIQYPFTGWSYTWDAYMTDEDGTKWRLHDLFIKEGSSLHSSSHDADDYLFVELSGSNAWHKDNWKVFCKGKEDLPSYDYIKALVNAEIIPPETSETDRWYHLSIETNYQVLYYNTADYHYFPAIFHDFSNIPVTICNSDSKLASQCGSDYWEAYYNMLSSKDNISTMEMSNHPIFYNPGLWRWVYYIDQQNKIQLTADRIDWTKFMLNDWDINLNVSFNTNTNYMLDIKPILNDRYPMTKTGMEFITQDTTTYPFTCEAFNNWYQQNLTTVEMSKRAKDISNSYALKNGAITGILGAVGGGISGSTNGAVAGSKAGPWGAAAGGIVGGIGGIMSGIGNIIGAQLAVDEANEQWNNEWENRLAGIAGQLGELANNGGFTSGSLVYSPNKKAISQYELFRRYSAPYLTQEHIWHDVSMNGEWFISQCLYKEYNNRKNFNIVQCNMIPKQYFVKNFLKQRMFEISPMFAQDDFIESFMSKCANAKSVMRLFKIPYDQWTIDDMIKSNIELKLQWCTAMPDIE